jgi:diketogulonate reductase-like aldo/keto reductase
MSRIGTTTSSEASSLICANGAGIPCIGFGTFSIRGAKLKNLLVHAIRAGFRHIDKAQVYGNEDAVGEGVQMSGISRDDVFITTKVWVENYTQARFERSVDMSLKALRTDYIDLLLLHWPSSIVPLEDQIGWLNTLVHAGKVLSIGVSNFNRTLVERAVELSDIPSRQINSNTTHISTRRVSSPPPDRQVLPLQPIVQWQSAEYFPNPFCRGLPDGTASPFLKLF